ncbi:MAG TPA: endopeptidase La [Candidatus Polarisedimenticolia bacterium]|nr:endopeptidase La [Candidatus Polarisedimenticolia bacterium]
MSGTGNHKKGASDKALDKSTAEKIAAAGIRAHGDMLACDIPAELPVIPLASTVVFPQMVVNLQVVRKKNLNLIRDMEPESIIGLVVQKSSSIDVPPIEELSTIGVAARLVNKINVSGNTIQIILLGLRRFKIASYNQTEPYLKARVACIDEKEDESMEANMLMGNALHLLENLIQLDPRVPGEILNLIKNNLSGPGNLADQVANHLNFELEEKKEILTTIDPIGRLKVAIRLIEKAIGLAKAGQEIKEQTEDEIRKAQREFFLREQLKVIKKELGEESETAATVRELREKVDKAGLTEEAKKEAEKELGRLEMVNPASAEYNVITTYLDWLATLPWATLTVDRLDVKDASRILDRDHYDLEKVKDRILEFLAVRQLKSDMKGPILCFYGPPGTGKTSLGRSIAEALGRKFVRMSVGGMRDEAEIRGHRRTYVGAMPGKIIQSLRRAGSRNPLFMIDEVDKIGMDFRGDPASALLEVLDPEQNGTFTDLYLDLQFDLSRVMFITTANRLDTIPDPLRDRMEILHLPGYVEEEKLDIARQFLIPRQVTDHGLTKEQITITEDALKEIIRGYTSDSGLRKLEQQIATICRKIAKEIAMGRPKARTVEPKDLGEFLGPIVYIPEVAERNDEVGVSTGLAWTSSGGDILFIEASRMKGNGVLSITGQLGDVMKESAQAAMTYVKSHSRELEIDEGLFEKTDIHIHVPAGAIPKDGPSAGVTIVAALASLMSQRPVRHDLAMTGEVTLRGKVLPVGGIKEKILAARRAGIVTVLMPARNEKDLVDIPAHIRKQMKFVFVREVGEVLDHALCSIILAKAEAIPVEARRARVRERVQKRKERVKPRAAAANGSRQVPR